MRRSESCPIWNSRMACFAASTGDARCDLLSIPSCLAVGIMFVMACRESASHVGNRKASRCGHSLRRSLHLLSTALLAVFDILGGHIPTFLAAAHPSREPLNGSLGPVGFFTALHVACTEGNLSLGCTRPLADLARRWPVSVRATLLRRKVPLLGDTQYATVSSVIITHNRALGLGEKGREIAIDCNGESFSFYSEASILALPSHAVRS